VDDVNPSALVDEATERGGDRRDLAWVGDRRVEEVARDEQELGVPFLCDPKRGKQAFPQRQAHRRVPGPGSYVRVREVGEDEPVRSHPLPLSGRITGA